MPLVVANDGCPLYYQDLLPRLPGPSPNPLPPLILIHGFTGASDVFQRNIPHLSRTHRVVAPDLRGHGRSGRTRAGHHVARLAMDLHHLIVHLDLPHGQIRVVAGSLGCAILWSYAELFTTAAFSHVVLVDQAPLQDYAADGSWGSAHGNRSCHSAAALAHLQATLHHRPDDVYRGTIQACLAYRSHPRDTDAVSAAAAAADTDFFLGLARQGDPTWFGLLMADHTSLDWRRSIQQVWGGRDGSSTSSTTRVLVVASSRSGCFPAAGPLAVVALVNGESTASSSSSSSSTSAPSSSSSPSSSAEPRASGVTVDWGGHWCYWEDPERFNILVTDFLAKPPLVAPPTTTTTATGGS